MKRLFLIAVMIEGLYVPALAQSHSPLCDSERANAKTAIAVMDQETDWMRWYSSTRPKLNGQPVLGTTTGIIRPHDLKMIQAHKDRSQALQVMLDNQCLAVGSEEGFRNTIREDLDGIKGLESIEATETKKEKDVEADAITKVGVCGNLNADLSLNLDQINANNLAIAELIKSSGSVDRRKELGRDDVARLTKLTASIKSNGEGCGMTAQDVQKTIDQYAAVIKMFDWAN